MMHVSMRICRAVLISLCLGLLVGCEALFPPNNEGAAASAPLVSLIQGTPADAVSSFLDAWGRRDYNAMYAQLSPESQRLISLPVFRATYEQADGEIGTSGVTYTLWETTEQGMTAAVKYDISIASNTFGTIDDPGRTMRVVKGGDGVWRVAWTTMDIFDGFAAGARLDAIARRPPRGNIYDRNGQLLVEQDGETVTLFVSRQTIPNYEGCLDLMATLLRRERAELAELFTNYNADTVFPVGDVDPAEYEPNAGSLTNTCGALTDTRTTRRYVGHGITAHTVGYVGQIPSEQMAAYTEMGYEQGDLVGLSGIELAYEAQLAGTPTRALQIVEPGGLVVRELAGAEGTEPQAVVLTLDVNLQRAAQQALSDAYNFAVNNWGSREHSTGGGVVALDVNTGAVLALASYPTFDQGIFSPDTPLFQVGDYIARLSADARRPFINRVTQNQYFPGSTFKIVTMSAAANERLVAPGDPFYCGLEWRGQEYGDTLPVRLDWRASEDEEYRIATGQITIEQALTASCNPFFYQMGALLYSRRGAGTLAEYARRMGFGQQTGLAPTLPEVAGSIVPPNSVEEAINVAIGQHETQVTIIQMARMVAAIANGGTVYQTYIVQQVGGEDGETPSFMAQPQVVGELNFSPSTYEILRTGMCAVTRSDVLAVDTGSPLGTAWGVFDDPQGFPASYSVCGKTGTAQTGRIEPHGWFVAFAPADNPQIAVAAMIEHGREGSETGAWIVRRLLDAYFRVQPAPFPGWWLDPYDPLNIPQGSTGG
jgi:cell division protein FtsI/penicillin-binding protein 2